MKDLPQLQKLNITKVLGKNYSKTGQGVTNLKVRQLSRAIEEVVFVMAKEAEGLTMPINLNVNFVVSLETLSITAIIGLT